MAHTPLPLPRFSLCLLIALTSLFAHAQTQVININAPAADTHITRSKPDENFGTNTTIHVRNAENRNYSRLGYIRFDLGNQLTGPITEAKLTLYLGSIYRNRTEPNTILIYGWLGDTWDEHTLTDNNAHWKSRDVTNPPPDVQLLGSFKIGPSGHAQGGMPFPISTPQLAEFLENAKLHHKQNVTFIIAEQSPSANLVTFVSKENPSFPATSLSITMRKPD